MFFIVLTLQDLRETNISVVRSKTFVNFDLFSIYNVILTTRVKMTSVLMT